MHPIISRKEAVRILTSKERLILSLDLGKTTEAIEIRENDARIRDQIVPLDEFRKVKDEVLYVIMDNCVVKAAFFSEDTNFYYKLYPTSDWPTITFSSTPMHRHTNMSPKEDTMTKIKEISPVKGVVLDTCCGLGYTAITASRDADFVDTFERDYNVLHAASFNPWSEELFNSKKIKVHNKDILEGIKGFDDGYFDRIVHDPPTFKYSPEVYSKGFYKELYRVLRAGGMLYHYAPAPHKTRGEEFHKKIIKGLKEAGFKDVAYSEKSSGVRAIK